MVAPRQQTTVMSRCAIWPAMVSASDEPRAEEGLSASVTVRDTYRSGQLTRNAHVDRADRPSDLYGRGDRNVLGASEPEIVDAHVNRGHTVMHLRGDRRVS